MRTLPPVRSRRIDGEGFASVIRSAPETGSTSVGRNDTRPMGVRRPCFSMRPVPIVCSTVAVGGDVRDRSSAGLAAQEVERPVAGRHDLEPGPREGDVDQTRGRVDAAHTLAAADEQVPVPVVADVVREAQTGVDRRAAVARRLRGAVPGEPLKRAIGQLHPVDVTLDRRHGEVAAGRIDGEPGHGGKPSRRGDDAGAVDPANASLVHIAEVQVALAIEDDLRRLGQPRPPGRSAVAGRARLSGSGQHLPAPGLEVVAQDLVPQPVRDVQRRAANRHVVWKARPRGRPLGLAGGRARRDREGRGDENEERRAHRTLPTNTQYFTDELAICPDRRSILSSPAKPPSCRSCTPRASS